jgi:hypothetical protein
VVAFLNISVEYDLDWSWFVIYVNL